MFIRYISHEIRNPLHSMVLGLQFLHDDLSKNRRDAMRLETVKDITSSCSLALGTLDEMLTVDKIGSGYLSVMKKTVRLLHVLAPIVQTFQNQVSVSIIYNYSIHCSCHTHPLRVIVCD